MAKGLGLEKFFSRKKYAAASNRRRSTPDPNIHGSVPPSPEQPDATEVVFPQAPYLRPTAFRMCARDNDLAPPSKPGSHLSPSHSQRTQRTQRTARLSSAESHDMNSIRRQGSLSSNGSLRIPERKSSAQTRQHDTPFGGMVPVQLPREPRRSADDIDRRAQFILSKNLFPQPPRKNTHNALMEALEIFPAPRVDTPPPSDHDESSLNSPKSPTHPHIPSSVPLLSQPTPGPSPEMIPMRDSLMSEPKSSGEFPPTPNSTFSRKTAPDDQESTSIPQTQPTNTSSMPKAVLQDPNTRDFLMLRDDDVAEARPARPTRPARPVTYSQPPRELPPPPPVLPPSARSPPFSQVTNHAMPASRVARRPIEVAALEAARIATKYDFDLLYIVNFWPTRMAHLHDNCVGKQASVPASPTESIMEPRPLLSSSGSSRFSTPRHSMQALLQANANPCSNRADHPNVHSRTGMTGRVLAAFGLDKIEAPFRLSSAAHKKILRTNGWIEWRQDNAKEDEFARGWACNFYAGHAPSNGIQSTPETESEIRKGKGKPRKKELNNRGIVFAAYRKPRGNGGTVHSGAAELAALYGEAEALVDLLLDFHVMQRKQETYDTARRASA